MLRKRYIYFIVLIPNCSSSVEQAKESSILFVELKVKGIKGYGEWILTEVYVVPLSSLINIRRMPCDLVSVFNQTSWNLKLNKRIHIHVQFHKWMKFVDSTMSLNNKTVLYILDSYLSYSINGSFLLQREGTGLAKYQLEYNVHYRYLSSKESEREYVSGIWGCTLILFR